MNQHQALPTVIFEDNALCVIAKPSGVTVNRSETTIHEQTLQDWVDEHVLLVANGAEEASDYTKRSGIAHRLDKETSGILLIGKTYEAFINLQMQFKERIVKKKYLALVHGQLTSEAGEINMPVGRQPWNRMRFGIVPGGKDSVTFYKVLHTYEWLKKEVLSLVELEPHTGRTHQIRVHMKYLNHPIFADYLYAGRKVSAHDRKFLQRVFLHAAEISFLHPANGEELSFSCPLSPELDEFVKNLKQIV